MKLHLPLCLLAVVCLGASVARAFSEIPEGYTVVPVSSAGDVAAYLNTGSHVFQSGSSLDMTGWAPTASSGGSAIFQVEGDMKVTSAGSTRTTFFNGNTTDSSLRIENTGAFEMQNGYITAHTVSFSGNGSSSVNIHGSISTSKGGAITQSEAKSNPGSLVVEKQASASFTDNKASSGGVIYRKYGQLTFDDNKLLNFQNNTATGSGGAIYCMTSATLEVTNNEVAVFSGNSATSNGGAIYAQTSAAGTTLSHNGVLKITDNSAQQYGGAAQFGTVLFDNNAVLDVSRNSSTSYGGAFYVSTQMTISNSQLVRFNDNKAQNPNAPQFGGAIYTGSSGKIFIQNNDTVEFRNNLSSCTIYNQKSTSITGNSHLIIADNSGINGAFALSGSGDTVNIDNNILVEITGNKASVDGGVISGGTTSLCGNTELLFTNNTAASRGGAVFNSAITISGNDKVVFRNNAQVDASGNTVLNSIYALTEKLTLCATDKTDSITFYDTINASDSRVSVSLNDGGAGRITFSGKYAAADLAARGGNYDVTASRTSVFGQALTVKGGVLEIADSAIIQTSTLSTSAGAAIELNSGTVKGNVYIVTNSALNVSGSSSVTGQLYFYKGADLNITLDASNLSNAALTLGSTLAGEDVSSVNFNVNSADLIDGKYKVMTGNGSAFANAEKGLSWENGALYLTVSGSDNVWHVRDNFTYGEAVDNSASQAISLDGGTMHLTKGLAAGVTLASTASTTLELAAGVTLEASALNELDHTMILSGEGVCIYNLDNSTAMNATFANWKGQVRVGDSDGNYTEMTNLDLAGLGERGSSIRLQGVQCSLADGEKTVEADVVLAAGNGIAAVVIDSAMAGDSVEFKGAVSSVGAVNFINDATVEHSYEFSGDVSGWKGQIVSNKGTLNLTYSGDARQIATDVRVTNNGSVLNLKVQNADTVVFSGVVKDAATWGKANRTLNVEIDNSGYETIFRNGVQADTVKLSNASTLVAQKEDGTARVSVTAHKGAQAQLKAVDVTDTGLTLHEDNQNGETRGLLENAAVVLGLDAPTAAALTADEGSAAAATVTYAVSDIDFKNTMLTAMAGTGVNLSNVSFDADSALKGDGSGMHLLSGAGNVLTLANNPMEVDTQTGTVTYTTSQLAGFTLAGGAGLLLDASALDLPAVAYGEYEMSIVLAGFTAEDVTPSVTITGQRWDSVGPVDYSWKTGDVGLVATFTAMVPEPATSTLSLLALAALAARRRRRA